MWPDRALDCVLLPKWCVLCAQVVNDIQQSADDADVDSFVSEPLDGVVKILTQQLANWHTGDRAQSLQHLYHPSIQIGAGHRAIHFDEPGPTNLNPWLGGDGTGRIITTFMVCKTESSLYVTVVMC